MRILDKTFQFKIEPQDVWVGLFWKKENLPAFGGFILDLYFCPFFCVLFHWRFLVGEK